MVNGDSVIERMEVTWYAQDFEVLASMAPVVGVRVA